MRRSRDRSTTAHTFPGGSYTSDIVGHTPRWLHADSSGCWVVGSDGIIHCDHAGSVTVVDDTCRVSASALVDGVLATSSVGVDELILRTVDGAYTAVVLPAEVRTIYPSGHGFVVLMRTGRYEPAVERGSWCARVGLDGTFTLGTAWEIRPWRGLDTVVDVGTQIAVGRGASFGQVLDGELTPAFPLTVTSEFPPWATAAGVWMVMRSSRLVHQLGDSMYATQSGNAQPHFTYFCLDRGLTRPDRWAGAAGFPIGLAVVPELDEVWISTSVGTFVGALESGAVVMEEAEFGAFPALPVTAPPELGDPDEWTERQRIRLLAENKRAGLIDIEIDGWFPTTTLILTFRIRGMRTVCARSMSVFDRDGRPRLWQGAPTLMEWIDLDIMEAGGLSRLRKKEPGRFGYVWI
ncbi:hypothetical protein [Rhodococcoides fascians]|uniref:hypothetical protein n=1 Tax=Rhodococcoides fascians TaxID=1828 RepID=UPI00055ED8A3|nr:hypothetical protein [Rhodococcus fascians]